MSTPALPQIATSDAPVPGVEVTPATRLRLLEFHRFEAEGQTFAYLVPSAAIFALDPCALALVDVLTTQQTATIESLVPPSGNGFPPSRCGTPSPSCIAPAW